MTTHTEALIEDIEPLVPHRITARAQRAWDAWDAYLFDVDGTLLRSIDRVHVSAFSQAVEEVLGQRITLDGVTLHGGTDTAILAEACRNAGVDGQKLARHQSAILTRMTERVMAQRDELRFRRMPGVLEMLDWLSQRGALLGVATGNLEGIGWTKIEACGLRKWFRFGGFSDRFPVRAELVESAAKQARDWLGDSAATVCVVGDTPRDIQAARANALGVIAVATGNYAFDELDALEPDFCCSSFPALMELAR